MAMESAKKEGSEDRFGEFRGHLNLEWVLSGPSVGLGGGPTKFC